ncbi:hypothetical protein ACFL5U_01590 [Candidatus Margulisiibacteriota bacterium]
MPLTGREKATIFLSILGAETSSRVLRYLPEELADLIAAGVNHLPTPSPDALAEVMNEFKGFVALPFSSPPPQLEEGEERPLPSRPRKSYAFLMYERPQMVAYLLSLLPDEKKEEILLGLPRDRAMVEELLAGLKKNPISIKLEASLKKQFGEKLFSKHGII